jgi:hypothetical protein
MADKMTFAEYIRNPTGARSRMVGEADTARAVYNDKYNKMLLLCAGHINYILWKDEPKRYIIYIQMPSETTKNLYYDVFVEFTATDDVKFRIGKLDGYNVRFFSNDPNFTFTYAYAFNKRGLLIPELVNKVSKKALGTPPHTTNPNELAGYVKSIYFAYLFMENRGLFNKLMWLQAIPMSQMKNWVQQYVMDSDRKYLYAQNFQKVAKQAGRPGGIRVSGQDPKTGLERAAKAVDTTKTYSRKIRQVAKASSSHNVSTVKTVKTIKRR